MLLSMSLNFIRPSICSYGCDEQSRTTSIAALSCGTSNANTSEPGSARTTSALRAPLGRPSAELSKECPAQSTPVVEASEPVRRSSWASGSARRAGTPPRSTRTASGLPDPPSSLPTTTTRSTLHSPEPSGCSVACANELGSAADFSTVASSQREELATSSDHASSPMYSGETQLSRPFAYFAGE